MPTAQRVEIWGRSIKNCRSAVSVILLVVVWELFWRLVITRHYFSKWCFAPKVQSSRAYFSFHTKVSAHQSLLYFYLPRDPENIQVTWHSREKLRAICNSITVTGQYAIKKLIIRLFLLSLIVVHMSAGILYSYLQYLLVFWWVPYMVCIIFFFVMFFTTSCYFCHLSSFIFFFAYCNYRSNYSRQHPSLVLHPTNFSCCHLIFSTAL